MREIAVVIQTYPERLSLAVGLQKLLHAEGLFAQIAVDADWWEGPPSAVRGAMGAWRAALATSADSLCVLQDDALLSIGFGGALRQISEDMVTGGQRWIVSLFASQVGRTGQMCRLATMLGFRYASHFSHSDTPPLGMVMRRDDAERYVVVLSASHGRSVTRDTGLVHSLEPEVSLRVACPSVISQDVAALSSLGSDIAQPWRIAACTSPEAGVDLGARQGFFDAGTYRRDFPYYSSTSGRVELAAAADGARLGLWRASSEDHLNAWRERVYDLLGEIGWHPQIRIFVDAVYSMWEYSVAAGIMMQDDGASRAAVTTLLSLIVGRRPESSEHAGVVNGILKCLRDWRD